MNLIYEMMSKTSAPSGVERLPSGGIKYRGKTFPGYNKPRASDRPKKKKMVLAKKGDKVKVVHFGQKGYKHNYSAKAKKSYLARSAGIKGKDDKFSANYWARRVLWPRGQKADGSSKKTASAKFPRQTKNPPGSRVLGETVVDLDGFKTPVRIVKEPNKHMESGYEILYQPDYLYKPEFKELLKEYGDTPDRFGDPDVQAIIQSIRMSKTAAEDTGILIPAPKSEAERLKELPLIQKQYNNRYNPEHLQDILDKDMSLVLDKVITAASYPSRYKEIQKYITEIKPSIQKHKTYFDIERPEELARRYGVPFKSDFLESAQTPSYPSGHTAQAYYAAYKLADEYPQLKDELIEAANMVANSRIDRGVHYPSDNKAGIILAQSLYSLDDTKTRSKTASFTDHIIPVASGLSAGLGSLYFRRDLEDLGLNSSQLRALTRPAIYAGYGLGGMLQGAISPESSYKDFNLKHVALPTVYSALGSLPSLASSERYDAPYMAGLLGGVAGGHIGLSHARKLTREDTRERRSRTKTSAAPSVMSFDKVSPDAPRTKPFDFRGAKFVTPGISIDKDNKIHYGTGDTEEEAYSALRKALAANTLYKDRNVPSTLDFLRQSANRRFKHSEDKVYTFGRAKNMDDAISKIRTAMRSRFPDKDPADLEKLLTVLKGAAKNMQPKKDDHPTQRLKERTNLDPSIIGKLRSAIKQNQDKIPDGDHHVELEDGSRAVIKELRRRHVLATILASNMTRYPGQNLQYLNTKTAGFLSAAGKALRFGANPGSQSAIGAASYATGAKMDKNSPGSFTAKALKGIGATGMAIGGARLGRRGLSAANKALGKRMGSVADAAYPRMTGTSGGLRGRFRDSFNRFHSRVDKAGRGGSIHEGTRGTRFFRNITNRAATRIAGSPIRDTNARRALVGGAPAATMETAAGGVSGSRTFMRGVSNLTAPLLNSRVGMLAGQAGSVYGAYNADSTLGKTLGVAGMAAFNPVSKRALMAGGRQFLANRGGVGRLAKAAKGTAEYGSYAKATGTQIANAVSNPNSAAGIVARATPRVVRSVTNAVMDPTSGSGMLLRGAKKVGRGALGVGGLYGTYKATQ